MTKLKMPDFATDAEEAKWWFDNQEAIADEYIDDNAPALLALLFNEEDVQLASVRAQERGVSASEYVRSLLHQALHQQAA